MFKKKLSIKYKLILMITLTTLASSMIGLYIINQYVQNKTEDYALNEAQVFVKLIGEYVVPAIAFNDHQGGFDIISKVKLLSQVSEILVLDTLGVTFVDFKIDSNSKEIKTKLTFSGKDTSFIYDNNVIVESKISYDGINYGYIIIKSKYEPYDIIEKEFNLSLLIVISIIVLISLILSASFQKVISKPIVDLTNMAHGVLESNNYNVQLKEEIDDEVGLLNKTFNAMFAKIRKHNDDRDRAVNIMQENEKKYRALFDYSPIPMFLFDAGICTMSNYASFNLFKSNNPKDILGKNFKSIFISESTISYDNIFYHRQFNKRHFSSDFLIIDKNNNKKQVELTSVLVHNDNLSSTIVMCLDIHEKKEYEKKLLQLNEDLEIRVALRTAILEEATTRLEKQNTLLNQKEKELMIAKEEAEKANKIKSEFIANISHEIRTPMNIIKGYSEMLYKKLDNPDNMKILKTIVYSSEMLLSIINDILDLSKIEAGKLEIIPNTIEIRRILNEIYNMFYTKCEDKNINLIFDIDKDMPQYLVIDKTRFNQILFNLLSNAIKFTERGYVKLICKHKFVNDNLINLNIIVQDTGIGIKKKNLDVIFDAFTQERIQEKQNQIGSGLGLTITKILIEKMNGNIHVESEFNQGTTFEIKLNNIEVIFENETNNEIKELNINFDGNIKALIVDDFDLNREVLKSKLDDFGIKSYEADNLKTTIEMINSIKFDIIFLDLIIPEYDGIEIASQIMQSSNFNNCPIIAYTASNNYLKDIENSNFEDVLNKPIKNSDLLNMLKKYINLKEEKIDSFNKSNTANNSNEIDREQLVELIELIKNEWEDYAVELSQTMIIDDIKEFIEYIKKTTDKINVVILNQYISNLEKAVQNYDINKYKHLLLEFGDLRKELELLLN